VSNQALGDYSTVPGGYKSVAGGTASFAAGLRARAVNSGAFVWADANSSSDYYYFASESDNEFAARATGGVRFVTAVNASNVPTAGVALGAGGGSWTSISDRAAKQDLTDVDPQAVLSKLVAIPVYTWRYRTEVSRALHMGPTAQDFRAAFGLGDSDKTITTIDEAGVALAAIQGLHQLIQDKDAQIAIQRQRIADLEDRMAQVESLRGELAALRQALAELRTAKEAVAAGARVQ
jgi:hypothetical protein